MRYGFVQSKQMAQALAFLFGSGWVQNERVFPGVSLGTERTSQQLVGDHTTWLRSISSQLTANVIFLNQSQFTGHVWPKSFHVNVCLLQEASRFIFITNVEASVF